MKKIVFVMISILLVSVSGCKKDTKSENNSALPTIGIAKLLPHPGLNAVEEGIQDELKSQNIKVNYDFQNANGEMSTINAIADKFKREQVDIAVGISTPIALGLVNAIKERPVVFAAITDPVSAKLVKDVKKGEKNITGTSDAVDIDKKISDFLKIYPFKTLGIIYTTSEDNSVAMFNSAKIACEKRGIQLIGQAVTSISEIKQAAQSLVKKVDAFYVVNDNNVCSSLSTVTETATANKKPVFSTDPSSSTQFGGVLYTVGADYYVIGRLVGQQIIDILNGKKTSDIPVRYIQGIEETKVVIDRDVEQKLGITIPQELIPNDAVIIQNGKVITK